MAIQRQKPPRALRSAFERAAKRPPARGSVPCGPFMRLNSGTIAQPDRESGDRAGDARGVACACCLVPRPLDWSFGWPTFARGSVARQSRATRCAHPPSLNARSFDFSPLHQGKRHEPVQDPQLSKNRRLENLRLQGLASEHSS